MGVICERGLENAADPTLLYYKVIIISASNVTVRDVFSTIVGDSLTSPNRVLTLNTR